jgi:hypothetical protein
MRFPLFPTHNDLDQRRELNHLNRNAKKEEESTVDSKRFSVFEKIDGLVTGHFVSIRQCV